MVQKRSKQKGIGYLALGSLLLAGVVARAGESKPPLAVQLSDLGRQAMEQGRPRAARNFFRKALDLDPSNAAARRGLDATQAVVRVALQDPPPAEPPAPAPAPEAAPDATTPAAAPVAAAEAPNDRPPGATLEETARLADVSRQQLTDDVRQRIQEARNLLNQGQPESAFTVLKLAENVVRSADQVDEATRKALDREIQAHCLSTVRAEERIVDEPPQVQRLTASAEQQTRSLELLGRNQATVSAMMTQFDALMAQGQYNMLYNGGTGDLVASAAPFYDARLLAQQARALDPAAAAPRAGMFVSTTMAFWGQEMGFEQLKEFRFLITMQDVSRAMVPFPDSKIIEYPDAEVWRTMSERRIKRYGKAVDLLDRDPKTKSILSKLDEPISMSFANETPLEDVLKYIKSATQGPNDTGIPIYVDPVGLQEAEKTMTSPIMLDLEGVPLKTTLRLLLKQLGMTYTVKDGMLTITAESSEDQPTEIRVYPVADLAIIPMSLMGGGMGGGMGGMRGGMGGGMGGMGGGMGGMGGGMGGMGGGMGGMGMMSIPVQAPGH